MTTLNVCGSFFFQPRARQIKADPRRWLISQSSTLLCDCSPAAPNRNTAVVEQTVFDVRSVETTGDGEAWGIPVRACRRTYGLELQFGHLGQGPRKRG